MPLVVSFDNVQRIVPRAKSPNPPTSFARLPRAGRHDLLSRKGRKDEEKSMNWTARVAFVVTAFLMLLCLTTSRPASAQEKKPNILFIMGDDIGWMQPSIYHRGLMVGETPNIDRIGNEGAIFMAYYAEQSCTAGRNAFFTGMHPLRTGMIPPQLPGSPSYLRPGTPALAMFLRDLGYTTGEFGKNHLGDHTRLCRRRTAFRNSGAISITWTRCKA